MTAMQRTLVLYTRLYPVDQVHLLSKLFSFKAASASVLETSSINSRYVTF